MISYIWQFIEAFDMEHNTFEITEIRYFRQSLFLTTAC